MKKGPNVLYMKNRHVTIIKMSEKGVYNIRKYLEGSTTLTIPGNINKIRIQIHSNPQLLVGKIGKQMNVERETEITAK